MKQLTVQEALEFYKSEKWKTMSQKEIALFQMQQEMCCIPFRVFHKAVEDTVGHAVLTHELHKNHDILLKEIKEAK